MRICRICLTEEKKNQNFTEFFDAYYNFASQLHFLTNISIVELKNLSPALICAKCQSDLAIAVKLKKIAFVADKFFKKLTHEEEIKLLKQEIYNHSQIKPEIITEELEDKNYVSLENFNEESNNEWKLTEEKLDNDEENFENCRQNKNSEEKIVKSKRKTATETKRKYKKGGNKDGLCSICGKNLWSTERLQNHIKVRHEIVSIDDYKQCPIEGCSKKFKIQLYVDRHVDNMHNPNKSDKKKKEESLPCLFCGIFLKSKSALKQHENRHLISTTPEKVLTHSCDICGYKADKKIKVQYHIERVHLHLRKFKCKLCSADFVHASLLQYHEFTVHLNIRKFVCRFNCGKSFTRSYCRTIHERIHKNERPYNCKFCERTFIHHSDWRRHEMKHTNSI
ncbi:hypothetical protein PVAND_017558 [Polypedilum vanderplanki]|uniref:Zinc finger protein n=1 Tax=Polypedilum vanderplanki TaxID=319348 RepID=A0A9J6BJE1_POLVA|nr:hypothetical protein PVAND_017558 [Polypedilum vanderplanki]